MCVGMRLVIVGSHQLAGQMKAASYQLGNNHFSRRDGTEERPACCPLPLELIHQRTEFVYVHFSAPETRPAILTLDKIMPALPLEVVGACSAREQQVKETRSHDKKHMRIVFLPPPLASGGKQSQGAYRWP